MRPITNEDIKILGRLVNISTEGVVADASQVYDSTQHKNQEVINSEMKNKTKNATTTTYGIVRLASGINDNDNTDTQKFLHKAHTFQQLPIGYPNYRQNISPNMRQNVSPRMGLPQMAMQQQPIMGYTQYRMSNPNNNIGVYQNNEQKSKAIYPNNIRMQYQNKNVNNHYYQYNTAPNVPNQNQDDGCCIQ